MSQLQAAPYITDGQYLAASSLQMEVSHTSHMYQKDGRAYICVVCGLIMSSNGRLKQHMRSHDTSRMDIYLCPKEGCQVRYNNQQDMTTHCHLHLRQSSLRCSKCSQKFLLAKQLKSHMAMKHTPAARAHVCEFEGCGMQFMSGWDLQSHRKTHKDLTFMCSICNSIFVLKQEFMEHTISTHKGQHQWHFCDVAVCDKVFKMESLLQQHMLTHGEEKVYRCSGCQVNYRNQQTLDRHLKKEQSAPPYLCTESGCRHIYTMGCLLTQHKAKAHGVGSMCHFCGKVYTTPSYFEKHLGTHIHLAENEKSAESSKTVMFSSSQSKTDKMKSPETPYTSSQQSNASQMVKNIYNMNQSLVHSNMYFKSGGANNIPLVPSSYLAKPYPTVPGQFPVVCTVSSPASVSPASVSETRVSPYIPDDMNYLVSESSDGSGKDCSLGDFSPENSSLYSQLSAEERAGPLMGLPSSSAGLTVEQCKNIMFNNLSKLHRSSLLNKNKVVCPICNAVFTCEKEFGMHMNFHNSFKKEDGAMKNLDDQPSHLPTAVDLAQEVLHRSHFETTAALAGQKYECPEDGCSIQCTSQSHLKQHMMVHTEKRCSGCNSVYKNSSSLRKHVIRESMLSEYLCDEEGCGETFPMGCVLSQHRAHVHGIGSLCFNCGTVYLTQSVYDKHRKIHEQLDDGSPNKHQQDPSHTFDGKQWICNGQGMSTDVVAISMQGLNDSEGLDEDEGEAGCSQSHPFGAERGGDANKQYGENFGVAVNSIPEIDALSTNEDNLGSCPLILNVSNEDSSEECPSQDAKPDISYSNTVNAWNCVQAPGFTNAALGGSGLPASTSGLQYNCPHCDKTFSHDDSLKQHMTRHKWEPVMRCTVKNSNKKTFSKKTPPQHHDPAHRGGGAFPEAVHSQRCPYQNCGEVFVHPGDLGKHILGVHIKNNHTVPAMFGGDPFGQSMMAYSGLGTSNHGNQNCVQQTGSKPTDSYGVMVKQEGEDTFL